MEHWPLQFEKAGAAQIERHDTAAGASPKNRLLRQLATVGLNVNEFMRTRHFDVGDTWPATQADARDVVFPLDAVGTLVPESMDGRSAALAIAGREGLWDPQSFSHAPRVGRRLWLVHASGDAAVVPRDRLAQASREQAGVHRLLCAWDRVLLDRVAQSALCHRHHDAPQQVATWLLLHHVRYGLESLPLRQTTLARVLGLRRESVSRAIGKLAARGAVSTDESGLAAASIPRLKACACECYRVDD
jgi:hypothetical protein